VAILDNIERIKAPSAEVFQAEYMLKQKPVIMTDLFAGQPIAHLSTCEQAAALLGDMSIEIQEEFTSSALKNSLLLDLRQKERCTFNEYLAYLQTKPDVKKMSTEGVTPAIVQDLFEPPAYAQINAEPGIDDTACLFFLGGAGNYAHLHFDGDYRQVLHHQVFGCKRVILIPPTQAKKLSPIGNFSNLFLENFSEADRAALVQYTHGYDCLLHPGETLFMPACIWHYLEYRETSMSFSIRFGRNEYTRFLGDKFHANLYLQNIAAKLIDQDVVRREYLPVMREIEALYHQPCSSAFQKGKAIQRLFESLYDRICTDSVQGFYAFNNFDHLAEKILQIESERLYQPVPSLMPHLTGWAALAAHS
jgi:Cupin-like domain